jgi:protein tyrosine phosphatase
LLEDVPHPSFPNIKIKKIKLTNTLKNTSKEVTHYHMTDWPDGRSPKQCQGVRFLLDKIIADIQNNAIPVVHCSAGVGRTGTLIAMAHLKLLIASNEPLSVFNEIRKMKEQRWGMIYTNSQYDYLYEYADHEIVKMQNGILSAHSEYSSEDEEGEDETK